MAKSAPKASPLRSMTGYGRGASENKVAVASVELRSVNGKGQSIKLRLPHDRLELESKVEAVVRKGIERGSLNGQVRVRLLEAPVAELDLKVLGRYLKAWRKAEKELGLETTDPSMAELLALPGAQHGAEESATVTRGATKAVLDATAAALESLIASREQEGVRLAKEMLRLSRSLRSLLKKVVKRSPIARRENEARLKERVAQALEAIERTEPIDLARELVVLAERADIQEEVARLEIHLDRLDEKILQGGAVGRELEFLVQECHREVTTLGNKSSDQGLSELGVAMKTVVQQMKEQLANVE